MGAGDYGNSNGNNYNGGSNRGYMDDLTPVDLLSLFEYPAKRECCLEDPLPKVETRTRQVSYACKKSYEVSYRTYQCKYGLFCKWVTKTKLEYK